MAENGNQNQGQNQGTDGGDQNKTFTQEQLDAIVADRLARQKKQYADYDDLKAKAAEYDKLDSSKSDIQKLQDSNQKLLDKIAGMEKQAKIEKARNKVSQDTGVPVDLLTGEDEDSCKKQAEAIMKFAKGKEYPGVKGTPNKSTKTAAAQAKDASEDDFRELAGQIFGNKD